MTQSNLVLSHKYWFLRIFAENVQENTRMHYCKVEPTHNTTTKADLASLRHCRGKDSLWTIHKFTIS